MFILKVCKALEEAQVPYAIVGGCAVALYGAVRGTIDLDIITNWSLENLEKLEKTLALIGLVSRLPIHGKDVFEKKELYITKRNLVAWNFYNPKKPTEQVDVIIKYDLSKLRKNTIETPLGAIVVLHRDDLIRMKKESGRPQDKEDVRALEQL